MHDKFMAGRLRALLLLTGTLSLLSEEVDQALADASKKPPSCSSATGGSSDSLMASTNGLYECAYTAGLDNKKIGPWESQTWTSSTAPGYRKQYTCHGQSGGVSIDHIYEATDLGSSITYFANNTEDGSRHWGAGVLWQTQENGGVADDQYIHNCDGNHGDIRSNKMYVTTTKITSYPGKVDLGTPAAVGVSVTTPYGNGPAQGTVYLYQQKDSSITKAANPLADWIIGVGKLDGNGNSTIVTGFAGQDPGGNPLFPKPGTVLIYAAMPTTPNVQIDPAPTPPNKGWVGSQSDSYQVKLTQKYTLATAPTDTDSVHLSGTEEASGLPKVSANQVQPDKIRKRLGVVVQNVAGDGHAPLFALCPKGTKPLTDNAWGDTRNVSANDVVPVKVKGLFGVAVRLPADRSNTWVQLQVVCRDTTADVARVDGLQYGTPRADQLTSLQAGSVLFGGLGDDTINLESEKSIGFGGPGHDGFLLSANQTVANGGRGNDRIEVQGSGEALIIGGPGKDTLIGGSGLTRINALDGEPVDRVVCNSPENLVMADEGDSIKGPCTRVYPDTTQY